MKNYDRQFTMLQGHLADEIGGIIQYVSGSQTCDNSDHIELHRALLEMHDDFPKWLQQRIAFLDQTPVAPSPKKG